MVAYSAYGVGKAEAAKVIARLESELAASLERLRKRPAIDPVQQFEKGREFSVLQGEHPTQVVLRLSPFLGMPYYAGMDVDWGDSEQDKLYFAGKSPELESQLVHTYTIDSGGQQSFNVVLTFYRSGEAMASLDRSQDANRSQTVKESFTLRVSEAGVRVVSGPDANVLSASITNPGQDDAVVSQPEPIIRMLLKAPPQAQPSPRQPDRVVHLVVRALDGPPEAREFSFIQPFSLSLASLVQAGGDSEHSFDTWVSLPGVELLQPPTRFEILLVELPVALVQQRIDRRIMDFDDPAVRREVHDSPIDSFSQKWLAKC